MTELDCPATHLYPGARLHILSRGGPETVVRFADGTSATGELADGILSLNAHRTAAGTQIPPRRWTVEESAPTLRIAARLP